MAYLQELIGGGEDEEPDTPKKGAVFYNGFNYVPLSELQGDR